MRGIKVTTTTPALLSGVETRSREYLTADKVEKLSNAAKSIGRYGHRDAALILLAYYLALRRTQGTIRTETPDWQPWLLFFLRSLQQQKARLEKKIERERLILGDLPELSVQLFELCRERGRITVAEAAKATGANRNTIKDHLKALARAGHIAQRGAGRGAWYGLA